MWVHDARELAEAIEAGERTIEVEGTISGSPSITLPEGATLLGGTLEFKAKGIRLTKDNTLRDITITTLDYEQAIYIDTSLADAATLRLENVRTVGQVSIVAEGVLRHVRVEVDGLHVLRADVRGRSEQPHGYNVDVLQGGLTLWNRQPDPTAEFTATLRGVSVGTSETPVRGSGVFVTGHGDREGNAAIVTHGDGARGFNLYDGTMGSASFESITTSGDGSIGIQVSKPMGPLEVRDDVVTSGGEGSSLVKGVQTTLKAVAVSIKAGADLERLSVGGKVSTEGPGLASLEVEEGARVRELSIGSVEAHGAGSRRIDIAGEVPEGSIG